MNTTSVRLFVAAAIVGCLVARAGAQTQGAQKTHTLFMGADVSVGFDGGLYAVQDVTGSSWVIDVNGRAKVISASQGSLNIKVTPSLKLTETSATVTNLKDEHGYTFANDPSVRLTRALTQTAVENADFHAAQNQAEAVQNETMAATQMKANLIDPSGRGSSNSPAQRNAVIQQTIDSGNQNLAVTNDQVGSDVSAGRNHPMTAGYDAMDVNFDISSAKKLQNPYVITMTRFHPKDGVAGMVQVLVYARSLNPIDSQTTNVHFLEGGFPFDFELVDFQLHVYDAGVEVATSVSSKRVELTADEAFEYVKMEYLGAHPHANLAPVPAMGKLPAELLGRLATGKYGTTIYARVSKEGLADEAFLDASCTKNAGDPFLDSVVKSIRFNPALSNGKAVEGVAAIRLDRLKI